MNEPISAYVFILPADLTAEEKRVALGTGVEDLEDGTFTPV